MSERDFEDLRKKLADFSMRKIEAAKLVLVDGLTQKKAADQQGLSKQTVNSLMRRIREIRHNAPAGWVLLSLVEYVPAEFKTEIIHRIAQLKEAEKEKSQ